MKNLSDLIPTEHTALGLAGAAVGAGASLWLGTPLVVRALLAVSALDVAAGTAGAWASGEWDSAVARKGLVRKLLMWLIVAAVAVVSPAIPGELPLVPAIAGFYCCVELGSVVEGAAKAGVPVPRFLKDAMAKVRTALDAGLPEAPRA